MSNTNTSVKDCQENKQKSNNNNTVVENYGFFEMLEHPRVFLKEMNQTSNQKR
jgi:hypothetical protein